MRRALKGHVKTVAMLLILIIMVVGALPARAASLGVSASTSPEELDGPADIAIILNLTNNSSNILEEVWIYVEDAEGQELGALQPNESKSFRINNYTINEYQIGGTIPITFEWYESGEFMSLDYPLEIKERTAQPSISLSRSVDKTSGRAGDKIALTYTVTNTGNVNINGIKIQDSISQENIAEGISLTSGESKKVTYEITLQEDVTSKPVAMGTSEDGTEVSAEASSTALSVLNPLLEVSVVQNAEEQDGTFNVVIKNTGNVDLEQITLQDDAGVIIEDGKKLAAGEESLYTHIIQSVEERQLIVTATCVAPELGDETLTFKSEGISVAPTYSQEDIVVTVEARLDKAELSEPGDVTVYFTVQNQSPIALNNFIIGEKTAGDLVNSEILPQGSQQFETIIPIARSGQLNFVLRYEDSLNREYSQELDPINILVTSTVPTETPQIASQETTNTSILFILILVLAALLIIAVITLIVVVIRERLARSRQEEEFITQERPHRQNRQDLKDQLESSRDITRLRSKTQKTREEGVKKPGVDREKMPPTRKVQSIKEAKKGSTNEAYIPKQTAVSPVKSVKPSNAEVTSAKKTTEPRQRKETGQPQINSNVPNYVVLNDRKPKIIKEGNISKTKDVVGGKEDADPDVRKTLGDVDRNNNYWEANSSFTEKVLSDDELFEKEFLSEDD